MSVDNKQTMKKLGAMIIENFEALYLHFGGTTLEYTLQDFKDVLLHKKDNVAGWCKPDDYHVTTYLVNKDEERISSKFYTEF